MTNIKLKIFGFRHFSVRVTEKLSLITVKREPVSSNSYLSTYRFFRHGFIKQIEFLDILKTVIHLYRGMTFWVKEIYKVVIYKVI